MVAIMVISSLAFGLSMLV
ncbi:hypothetical protein MWJ95_09170 [Lysinibacillus sp. Bpr_S20]|nr:hypothetical protein [Lysinibacillus sp. Bpr_S20]